MDGKLVWGSPKGSMPTINISSYGFQFNKPAIDLLGKPKGIKIGFDKEKEKIYFMAMDDLKKEKVYKFTGRLKTSKGYIRIGNKNFLRYVSSIIGIDLLNKTRQFALIKESKNICYINLKDEIK